jgi:hypothetical protein
MGSLLLDTMHFALSHCDRAVCLTPSAVCVCLTHLVKCLTPLPAQPQSKLSPSSSSTRHQRTCSSPNTHLFELLLLCRCTRWPCPALLGRPALQMMAGPGGQAPASLTAGLGPSSKLSCRRRRGASWQPLPPNPKVQGAWIHVWSARCELPCPDGIGYGPQRMVL